MKVNFYIFSLDSVGSFDLYFFIFRHYLYPYVCLKKVNILYNKRDMPRTLSRIVAIIFFCALGSFGMGGSHALAANLYISPNEAIGYRGDTLTLSVHIDPAEGECINAIKAVIQYDSNISAIDISRGSSIFSLWVEEPVIDAQNHTISFAGGIPNGYCGRIAGDPRLTNVIADIVFNIPGFTVGGSGGDTALVSFNPETEVLLNDGLGTLAPLTTFGAKVELKASAGTEIQNEWGRAVTDDELPPELFSIELVKDASAFSGKYFIAFSTTDKQTGIDHYEVYEEPIADLQLFTWGEPDRVWTTIESPYVLKDQLLRSVIRVKAIDKAGNERIATYAPDASLIQINPIEIALYASLGVLAIVIAVLIGYFIVRFVRNRRKKKVETLTNEMLNEHE